MARPAPARLPGQTLARRIEQPRACRRVSPRPTVSGGGACRPPDLGSLSGCGPVGRMARRSRSVGEQRAWRHETTVRMGRLSAWRRLRFQWATSPTSLDSVSRPGLIVARCAAESNGLSLTGIVSPCVLQACYKVSPPLSTLSRPPTPHRHRPGSPRAAGHPRPQPPPGRLRSAAAVVDGINHVSRPQSRGLARGLPGNWMSRAQR